jgi:hypothetical protein
LSQKYHGFPVFGAPAKTFATTAKLRFVPQKEQKKKHKNPEKPSSEHSVAFLVSR